MIGQLVGGLVGGYGASKGAGKLPLERWAAPLEGAASRGWAGVKGMFGGGGGGVEAGPGAGGATPADPPPLFRPHTPESLARGQAAADAWRDGIRRGDDLPGRGPWGPAQAMVDALLGRSRLALATSGAGRGAVGGRTVFDKGGGVFSKKGGSVMEMAAGDAAGGGGKPAKVPLTEFEAATYKASTGKEEIDDDLTADHIPSRAAVQKARETQLGRRLTKEEAKQLKQNTNTISVRTDIHRAGPTYKGKNTATQIGEDAKDLGKAARRDTDALLKNAKDQGADVKKAQEAVDKLHELNRNNGLYK